jgi:hypothetical protein
MWNIVVIRTARAILRECRALAIEDFVATKTMLRNAIFSSLEE